MATVVDRFPDKPAFKQFSYPWNDWLDGRVWFLTEGEDFESTHTFRSCVSHECKRRGLRYRTMRAGGGLYLQAVRETTEEKEGQR